MKRRFFAGLLLGLLSLTGCGGSRTEPQPLRVVTGIRVTGSENGQIWQKAFTDTEKMESVLHGLRQLNPGKTVSITPESFRADAYEIVLSFSDGSETVYQQLHHQYLQKDSQGYREISEGPAMQLAYLLRTLQPDHSMYS